MIESVLKEQEIRQLYSLEHNDGLKQNQTLIYARGHQQRVFRNELIKEFSSRCLVTKFDNECLLEAAHIIPHAYCAYKQTKDMYSKYNGLLLRSDIHKLFDRGYISFTHQNGRLLTMVDKRIHHFEEYQMLNGTEVNLPQEKTELWVEKIMERQMLK
jgi:predicted restriction endonuclease